MKTKLLSTLTALILYLIPATNFGQAPVLGTAADYVLFTSIGEMKNTGTSYLTHLTGNVGTNSDPTMPGFGNVNGMMTYTTDPKSIKCAADLLQAYNSLTATTPTNFPPLAVLGGGQILNAGVHSITSPSISLNLDLILDAQGNPNAVFVFKLQGAFSTNTNSKIKLVNGAKACNVFWLIGGAVDMGAGSTMRGTIIVDGAISIAVGDTLEGRALSIGGAVVVSQLFAYTPIGCGSPVLTGPIAPTLGATACYGIFSSAGTLSNTGITYITGDIGSNSSAPIGFNSLYVTGEIHSSPDGSTAQCASDLADAYTYLNTLPYDIELLFPAELGHNLVITPHTYIMKSAAILTDTLCLNAQGDGNAVFVIKVNGAFSTSVNSKIKLINGAQSKNVYWKIEGEVNIASNSIFCGTIICNNGALGSLASGVKLDGRALTTVGAMNTDAMSVIATMIPGNCTSVSVSSLDKKNAAITIFPNPFTNQLNIQINTLLINNYELRMYNVLGDEIINTAITNTSKTIETNNLPSGVYFYKVICKDEVIQSGKLISQK